MGPHSPVGNFSLVPVAEVQADYALAWIQAWQRGEFTAVAPSREATERYNAELRGGDGFWSRRDTAGSSKFAGRPAQLINFR